MTIQFNTSTITTTPVQNVAGTDGATGFFFLGSWAANPAVGLQYVRPGWTVVDNPGLIVSAVDEASQTITVSGGTFVSGQAYVFTGLSGLIMSSGITIS